MNKKEMNSQDWNHVVTMEDLGELKRKLRIVYDSTGVLAAMDKAAKNLGKQVKIKGFRKGKAPAYLIKQTIPKEVQEMASLLLSQEGFLHGCFENQIQPMGKPNVLKTSFEDNQFVCELELEVRPTIVPIGYLGIALTKQEFDVNSLVKQEIEGLRKMWAKETTKEVIENGNVAVVDFSLSFEDKELTSGKDQKFEILETNEEPFGKNLFGMKESDTFEKEMEIPKGFEGVSGKMGKISVEIKKVFEKTLLDDEGMCKQLQVLNFDEVKSKIEHSVRQHLSIKQKEMFEEQLVGKLIEMHDFGVPSGWVEDEKRYLQQNLQIQSVDEELNQKLKELSLRNVKRSFILDAIGDVEKIQVTEDELSQFVKQQAEQAKVSTLVVKKELKEKKMWDSVVMSIRQKKIMEFLLSQAQIADNSQEEELTSSFDIPDNPIG